MTAEPARVRDPEGTKRSVLDASERLFAERGFAGTSMRDIAGASGISQPLIHHHFGCKEHLYTAVRRRVIEDYAARFPDAARVADRPVDVGGELGRIFAFLRDNGSLLRLLAWARLEGNHRMWPGDAELTEALVRRIELAQRRGLVRPDLDPAYVCVMMVGLVLYWVDNRSYYAGLFPDGPDDDAYLRQAVALLERGLAPAGEASPDGGGR